MKHHSALSAGFVALLILVSTLSYPNAADAFDARVFGLRFSDTAYRLTPGSLSARAGVVFSRGTTFWGSRGHYAIWEDLLIYGEAGLLDVDADLLDPGLGVQFGAMYDLPLSRPLPIDFAVDATLAKPMMKDINAWSSRVSLIGKYNMHDQVPGLLAFAGVGISYTDAHLKGGIDSDANGMGLEFDVGADYRIDDSISLNAGIALLFGNSISDTAVSVGITYSPPLAK